MPARIRKYWVLLKTLLRTGWNGAGSCILLFVPTFFVLGASLELLSYAVLCTAISIYKYKNLDPSVANFGLIPLRFKIRDKKILEKVRDANLKIGHHSFYKNELAVHFSGSGTIVVNGRIRRHLLCPVLWHELGHLELNSAGLITKPMPMISKFVSDLSLRVVFKTFVVLCFVPILALEKVITAIEEFACDCYATHHIGKRYLVLVRRLQRGDTIRSWMQRWPVDDHPSWFARKLCCSFYFAYLM